MKQAVTMLIIDEIYKAHALHSSGLIDDTTHNVVYTILTDLKKEVKLL